MKLIIAIIQPTKLEAVKEALSQVEVFRLTVTDVQGFGRQKGYTEVYRGHEVTVNLLRKIELQIAVNEDFVEPTVKRDHPGGTERPPTARSATARSSSCRWTIASGSGPGSVGPRRSDPDARAGHPFGAS
jgi:nitrogen regulatory protein P-II 1